MEMKKVREYMEWYSLFFSEYVAPALERAGFTKSEAGFWGFNSFRRPFITVLESVGSKAYNDTVVFMCMILVPTSLVMVYILSSCGGVHIFTTIVGLLITYIVFTLSMYLFKNSFSKDRPFCEIGMVVYSGNEGVKKFLRRYSDHLVLLAISEAGKIVARFKRKRNCDDYIAFYSKLFNFNGFNNENAQE